MVAYCCRVEQQQTSASITFVVDEGSTAIALGSGDIAVLGTPKIVALCEEAAVVAVGGTLDDGQTTVGTNISIEHVAPTAVGATVIATATLVDVAGSRRAFTVEVTQDGNVVASGTHTRVAVDRKQFVASIMRK